jgi:hypothetical protein
MDIKIEKESVDYNFMFDVDNATLEKIDDAVYELDGVADTMANVDGLCVIVDGKHDTSEMLDKITSIINGITV